MNNERVLPLAVREAYLAWNTDAQHILPPSLAFTAGWLAGSARALASDETKRLEVERDAAFRCLPSGWVDQIRAAVVEALVVPTKDTT